MGEASRERSIAACALVPAMGISCGRGTRGDEDSLYLSRTTGDEEHGRGMRTRLRRRGWRAGAAHRRKLPRRRQRPPATVRSSRGGVVGCEDEKLESSGGDGGVRCEWRQGAWVTSRALLLTTTASTCVRSGLGARTGGGLRSSVMGAAAARSRLVVMASMAPRTSPQRNSFSTRKARSARSASEHFPPYL